VAAADLPALTGMVTVSGTATVGTGLTANTGSLGGTGAISYQWQRSASADNGFETIANATNETYTLAAEDQGKYVRVTVSRSGHSGAISSDATGSVMAADLPALTGTVTVSGTEKVGEVLTANTGSLDGTGAISYQWQRRASADSGFENIAGAANAAYTLAAEDQGKYVRVTVSRAGNNGTISSVAAGPVALPALSGTVTVSGTAAVGETLTANTGSLGGAGAISYQWQRGDSANGAFADIAGAFDASYTLDAADLGKYVRLTVGRSGHSGTISSVAAGPVAAATLPALTGMVAISGTVKVGETLTADIGSLGGSGTISYRWERSASETGGFENIPGATNGAYTPVAADGGKYLRVAASRAGNSGTIRSVSVKVPGTGGSFAVATWIGADGTLLDNAPEDRIVISKSAGETLAVTAASGMNNIKWFLGGAELTSLRGAQVIAIKAALYVPGFYYLSMYAEKAGVPYQINITFVVDN
jgi:hypothetical protein